MVRWNGQMVSCSRGSKRVCTIGSWPMKHSGLMNSLLSCGSSVLPRQPPSKRLISHVQSESMLPLELRHRSTRVDKYSDEEQEERRADNVNLLEEHRERVAVQVAAYQQNLHRNHEKHICVWCSPSAITSSDEFRIKQNETSSHRSGIDHTRWLKS